MKVYELLDNPEKWTKGSMARDKDGEVVDLNSENAYCWSVYGAILKCYPNIHERINIEMIIYRKMLALVFGYESITYWGDVPERTYEDVIQLCKELDI